MNYGTEIEIVVVLSESRTSLNVKFTKLYLYLCPDRIVSSSPIYDNMQTVSSSRPQQDLKKTDLLDSVAYVWLVTLSLMVGISCVASTPFLLSIPPLCVHSHLLSTSTYTWLTVSQRQIAFRKESPVHLYLVAQPSSPLLLSALPSPLHNCNCLDSSVTKARVQLLLFPGSEAERRRVSQPRTGVFI